MPPITLYPGGDQPVTPNLKLALNNMSLTSGNNFEILDAAFGIGIQINGAVVAGPNFVNSASATFSVVGNTVSLTTASGGIPGGVDTQIQYNKAGVFGADANLQWNYTLGSMSINNALSGSNGNAALNVGVPLANPVFQGSVMLTGGATYAAELEIHNIFSAGEEIYVHSNTGFRAPVFAKFRSRGTQIAPIAVLAGDALGFHQMGGYDGSVYGVGFSYTTTAAENWTPTAHGTLVTFNSVLLGTTNAGPFLTMNPVLHSLNLGAGLVFTLSGDTGCTRIGAGSLALGNGTLNDFSGSLKLGNTTLSTAAPTVAAAQVGLGSTTAATATAGGGQAAPATTLGYLVANVAGTLVKIPYYSA